MLRYRTHGTLAVGLGFLAVGCLSEPEIKTNLRPEGPPEILAVLATDAINGELASFCKYDGAALDEKAPGLVQGVTVCPDLPADFEAAELLPLVVQTAGGPVGWGVRLVFDELLDPDAVEDLICDADGDGMEDNPITTCIGTIANTQPVTLTCGGMTVPYDGYYYPNGNKESNPVGPALVVSPDPDALTFATGTTCTIAINSVVTDKDGVGVASGPDVGTFNLKLADLAVLSSDPEAERSTCSGRRLAVARVPSSRPGATQFTSTSGAMATAMHLVRWISPAFETA